MSYKNIVSEILDDPQHSAWFRNDYFGNEFDLRQELEQEVEKWNEDLDESKLNEDLRAEMIELYHKDGYSLSEESVDKDNGIATLVFAKGDTEVKVNIPSAKTED